MTGPPRPDPGRLDDHGAIGPYPPPGDGDPWPLRETGRRVLDPRAAGDGARDRRPLPAGDEPGAVRRRARRRWGALPGGLGVCVVAGGTVLGALVTVLTRGQPGVVLGVFLIASTLAAVLVVRPRAVYLIIPVPAPAYAVAAVLAGLSRDRAAAQSLTALALGAAQWIASGFLAMTAATVAAIVITAARRRTV